MVDKNVFTQELKKVFTILKEIKLVEKYVKELIDNNNLTEDKVIEFEEKLDQYKRDLDYINENTELLQESLNQININLEDLIEYVDSIKDFINQNENTTEVGGNLEVDGNITINSVDNLITKDGSSFGGGGSGKYLHNISLSIGNSTPKMGYIFFNIVNDNDTPINKYSILFENLSNIYIQCTGVLNFTEAGGITTEGFAIVTGVSSSNNKLYLRITKVKCSNQNINNETLKVINSITNEDIYYTYSSMSNINDKITPL